MRKHWKEKKGKHGESLLGPGMRLTQVEGSPNKHKAGITSDANTGKSAQRRENWDLRCLHDRMLGGGQKENKFGGGAVLRQGESGKVRLARETLQIRRIP